METTTDQPTNRLRLTRVECRATSVAEKVMMMKMKQMTLKQRIRADGHGQRDKVGSSAVTLAPATCTTSRVGTNLQPAPVVE